VCQTTRKTARELLIEGDYRIANAIFCIAAEEHAPQLICINARCWQSS